MKKNIYILLILISSFFSCTNHTDTLNQSISTEQESKIVTTLKKHIHNLKTPERVEVRNYIKDLNNKYQSDIKQIKKIKIKLDPNSTVYLELNLFTNEGNTHSPLVAQLLLFDIKTKNLISEDNLNLE